MISEHDMFQDRSSFLLPLRRLLCVARPVRKAPLSSDRWDLSEEPVPPSRSWVRSSGDQGREQQAKFSSALRPQAKGTL